MIKDRLRDLRARLRDPASVGGRAMSASLWITGGMALQYPLRLAGNLIMTQLLAPEAFGLMAAVTTLHIGLSLMTDIGIAQSVMRDSRGADPTFLRVAWVLQILRNGLIAAVLLLLALVVSAYGPTVAGAETVYADPDMPGLICVAAVALTMKGLESANILLARREMLLKRVLVIETVSQIASLAAMVAGGLILGTVWALAWGMIVGAFTRLVLSHTVFPGPRMTLAWNRVDAYTIWSFGKWLIGSSLGGFFTNYGDRMVLSALIDKTAFGVYFIAVVWIDVFSQLINRVSNAVYIPYFRKKLEYEDNNISAIINSHLENILIFIVIFISIICAFSDDLISILYKESYHYASIFMTILSFKLLMIYNNPARQYIMMIGDSRYFSVINVIGAVTSMAVTYLLAREGLVEWAVAAFAVGTLPTAIMTFLHREVRPHVNLALHVAILVVAVCACMTATYMLTIGAGLT